MDYQLRSRGIVPTLSYRNPYRYIGPLVRRTKNQKGGQFGYNQLRSRGIVPTLSRMKQRGGQFDLLTPAMWAAAKTLRSEAKYGKYRRRKQRGGQFTR